MKYWIYDDISVIARGLGGILKDSNADCEVTCFSEPDELIVGAGQAGQQPDLVCVHLHQHTDTGQHLIEQLKQMKPALPLIAYSIHPEEQVAKQLFRAGANAYLDLKYLHLDLPFAVAAALKGRSYLSQNLAGWLVSDLSGKRTKKPHEHLSEREFNVFSLIVSGYPIKKISDKLNRSPSTISTYRKRILTKMDMKSNAELINYAFRNKIF
ncbi:LuxR C-terminal-related transcriptional regulator [Leeia oryzae]|uniref:LuxR C-terminal-related transcriptional regulator n=1 Tax=Leeia oryzae TaxID=356662 RepID=UPI00037D5023|nr:response regulator transcription factor [Leeia oryzae]